MHAQYIHKCTICACGYSTYTGTVICVYIILMVSTYVCIYVIFCECQFKVIFDVLERHCLIQGKGLEFTALEYPLRVPGVEQCQGTYVLVHGDLCARKLFDLRCLKKLT